jgi:thioredoxin-related protein
MSGLASAGKIGRREFLIGAAALAFAPAGAARAEPVLGEDGLYSEPWFLQSFLVLGEDVAAADAAGKRFAVMWELRGCPYCKETHLVNFAQPRILDFIKSNFEVLQLNILGSRQVTDLDGEVLAEKDLARKYDVRYTPTFQFFGEDPGKLKALPPKQREVARAAGYLQPDDFLSLFRFVREKAYTRETLREYLKARSG